MTKNCNCMWCGKAPQKDLVTQYQTAIQDGDFDWEAYREHTKQWGDSYGEMFKMPSKKQWDQFMITAPVFPDWRETNHTVVRETRKALNMRERVIWDGESYRPHKVDGIFCTTNCAVKFAVATARQKERYNVYPV